MEEREGWGRGGKMKGGKDREGEGGEVDGRKGKWMEGRGQVGKEISREGDKEGRRR